MLNKLEQNRPLVIHICARGSVCLQLSTCSHFFSCAMKSGRRNKNTTLTFRRSYMWADLSIKDPMKVELEAFIILNMNECTIEWMSHCTACTF